VQDCIQLARYKDEIRHIVTDKREMGIPGQVRQVLRATRDEIVHPNHAMAFFKQPIT
jgi:hypothetical protein